MLSSLDMGRISLRDAPLWKARRAGASLAASSESLSAANRHGTKKTVQETAQTHAEETSRDLNFPLEKVTANPPPNPLVLQQLDRILRSRTFVQSEKLSRFLRFVVEHVIVGNPACLKEYLVGVEVYDRKPPYDPSQDSIVRTEARRLRNKLKEYYGAEGKEDPVYIYLRPGSYIPAFQSREDLEGVPSKAEPGTLRQHDPSLMVISILPFIDISGNALSATYSRGIPDELAYVLARNEGCAVVSPFSTACCAARGLDVAATMKKAGAQIAFEGSVRVEGSSLRITARIVDAAGLQLWVKRIDLEIGTEVSFVIEEKIANALSVGFDVVRTRGCRMPAVRFLEKGSEAADRELLLTVS